MSDFIFARKTSNLTLLCPAKARKPTEHQQMTLNPLAIKGTIAEKLALYARGRVQIYGFALLWLVAWCKITASVSAFGEVEGKIRLFCSGGLQWHQPTYNEVFYSLHNVIFSQAKSQAKSQANSQTELSVYQQVTAMCHKQTHKQSHKQKHKQKQCNKWYR